MNTPHQKRGALVSIAVGLLAATLVVRGCGSGGGTGVSADGLDDAAAADDPQDSSLPDRPPDTAEDQADSDASTQDTGCPSWGIPLPDVPAGWAQYPVFGCADKLYVPPTRELLPPPLVWETCTQDVGPDPYDCRQIKVDWPTDAAPYAIGGPPRATVLPDGRVVMELRKVYWREGESEREIAYMAMVVEADGPVRQAFWQDYLPGNIPAFGIAQRAISLDKSSWTLIASDGSQITRYIGIGGDDTDLSPPILLDRFASAPDSATAFAGSEYYLETGASWRVRGWDGTDKGLAAQGAGALSPPSWVGPVLLWAVESNLYYRVRRWTEQDGSKELVGFGSDTTKGAGNPGSDGHDLVWIQGEDLGPTDESFPTRSVFTSPFSTDPAKIQPRRLRSWDTDLIGTPADFPPAVGCGHAAFHYFVPGDLNTSILIVRLADGQSWKLRAPQKIGLNWGPPIAITCTELFAAFAGSPIETVRRVRLDSLGPGEPAN